MLIKKKHSQIEQMTSNFGKKYAEPKKQYSMEDRK